MIQLRIDKHSRSKRNIVKVYQGNSLVADIYPGEKELNIISQNIDTVKRTQFFPPGLRVVFSKNRGTKP